jgi:hypothetical protein
VTSRIRPYEDSDTAAVADLWMRVFRGSDAPGPASLQACFREMFLCHPWRGRGFDSLVCEQEDAGIVGFLGVLPRPMRLEGQPIFAAASSQFMIDRKRHRGLGGIELMKRFLAGPQELSFTDGASDAARRIWEALGGEALPSYGATWTRVLRPAAYFAGFWRERNGPRALCSFARFAGAPLDAAASRTGPYAVPAQPARGEELDDERLLECIAGLPAKYALRPDYDRHSLCWLLGKAAAAATRGELCRVLVRDASGEPAGWYVYYAKPGGVSKVLQIGGQERTIGTVIAHLMRHAWERRSLAVGGRLEPRFARQLSQSRCRFDFPDLSVLAHARNREILHILQRGGAFLTRLDGEWWMRFHEEEWS